LVYIALPTTASLAESECKHLEGPTLVNDYTQVKVLADGGTLFTLDPSWLEHFLGIIGFTPLPP
jgi:hypothetical protein